MTIANTPSELDRAALDASDVMALEEALVRMNLLADGESAQLTALTGGVSARIVAVRTPTRLLCVKQALPKLRVKADWAAPTSRNTTEVAWLRVVSELCPRSVPQVLGEDRQSASFAMSYLDPASHPVWKHELQEGRIDPGVARAVALLMLRIHNATADDGKMAEMFATDETFVALRLEPYFFQTARAHPDLTRHLQELSSRTLTQKRALIHGDVSPKNVLLGPGGPLLLDAECAWYGDPAFDLAFCLNHLLLKCVLRPQSAQSYLESFDSMANSYLDGITWEPTWSLEARASALLPALLLARVDGKSPVEYIVKDGTRAAIRAFAKPFIRAPARTLASIRLAWTRSKAYE